MTLNKRAALPVQAGTQGKAAPTTATDDTISRIGRQFYKVFVVAMAVRGIISPEFAQELLKRRGLLHD